MIIYAQIQLIWKFLPEAFHCEKVSNIPNEEEGGGGGGGGGDTHFTKDMCKGYTYHGDTHITWHRIIPKDPKGTYPLKNTMICL